MGRSVVTHNTATQMSVNATIKAGAVDIEIQDREAQQDVFLLWSHFEGAAE